MPEAIFIFEDRWNLGRINFFLHPHRGSNFSILSPVTIRGGALLTDSGRKRHRLLLHGTGVLLCVVDNADLSPTFALCSLIVLGLCRSDRQIRFD
ncbi:hypothetical protein AFLA_013950 [Aspergillus flavus NRRL3357]|nr:hypothetical protein AFLA_013950 [Aspergillus flavus NRRL3357]